MGHRLLIVDDDRANLLASKRFLELAGYRVSTAASGKEAIETMRRRNSEYALCLVDFHMPEMAGPAVISEIKRLRPKQQIVAFTADGSADAVKASFRAGAADFAEKSLSNEAFLDLVQRYCKKYDEVFRTIREAEFEAPEGIKAVKMVGRSKALGEVARLIRKFAPLDSTVLILGETGTGKELVAKALHCLSGRAAKPFIGVNCNEIPQDLVESTLFGHRKGSFTGAIQDQAGRFQAANRGTIFLDEIGDLSPSVQAKLLRVLQEKIITPVGASHEIKIDVRVLAATHRNIPEMIEAGTFREDLYYRLNVLQVKTPPLRDRPDDIEPLIAHFVEKICVKLGIDRTIQRTAIERLKAYSWPGNVRQLEGEIESHLARCEGSEVTVEQLDAKFFKAQPQSDAPPTTLKELEAALETAKQAHILKAVEESKTKAEAAKKLGISPSLLQFYLARRPSREAAGS